MSFAIPSCLRTTLKIQPAVMLFSSVSVLAKLASGMLPPRGQASSLWDYVVTIVTDFRIVLLVALMFFILGLYAIIWQILIKNAQIAVIYANKSSYLLWAQIAAVLFFGEHLSWSNVVGIAIIFAGIMLSNGAANVRT
jgi:drug/metabolite transporter (DMT)-like permease